MKLFKRKENKKPLSRRTKFTAFSMFNIVWYTIIVIIASFYDHIVPSELTVAWFSAWTVELALLFGIKIKSIRDESNCGCSNESSDEIESEDEIVGEECETDSYLGNKDPEEEDRLDNEDVDMSNSNEKSVG